jgi:GNAT superfamily N-acetyltransferase
MTVEFRATTTEADWIAYHAIRRRVLFELRGQGAVYDPNHPDDQAPSHYPFVLWDADEAVGVIRVDAQDDVALLRRVAVREDLQRQGYGRSLLRAAERFASAQGCTRAVSHVDAGAVEFYERCGFRRVGPPEGWGVHSHEQAVTVGQDTDRAHAAQHALQLTRGLQIAPAVAGALIRIPCT